LKNDEQLSKILDLDSSDVDEDFSSDLIKPKQKKEI
jgi:hypothetical protein